MVASRYGETEIRPQKYMYHSRKFPVVIYETTLRGGSELYFKCCGLYVTIVTNISHFNPPHTASWVKSEF